MVQSQKQFLLERQPNGLSICATVQAALREDLIARGVAVEIIDETLSQVDSPSLREAMVAKMKDWKLRTPLQPRDAARLFRALLRLGYDEDAIREVIEEN